MAFHSTTRDDKGSKIVPVLSGLVTDSRMEPMFVVTEHGITNLKGKTNSERALSLIELASPRFRDELLGSAKKMGLIR